MSYRGSKKWPGMAWHSALSMDLGSFFFSQVTSVRDRKGEKDKKEELLRLRCKDMRWCSSKTPHFKASKRASEGYFMIFHDISPDSSSLRLRKRKRDEEDRAEALRKSQEEVARFLEHKQKRLDGTNRFHRACFSLVFYNFPCLEVDLEAFGHLFRFPRSAVSMVFRLKRRGEAGPTVWL